MIIRRRFVSRFITTLNVIQFCAGLRPTHKCLNFNGCCIDVHFANLLYDFETEEGKYSVNSRCFQFFNNCKIERCALVVCKYPRPFTLKNGNPPFFYSYCDWHEGF